MTIGVDELLTVKEAAGAEGAPESVAIGLSSEALLHHKGTTVVQFTGSVWLRGA
jgi:hypothetical protein